MGSIYSVPMAGPAWPQPMGVNGLAASEVSGSGEVSRAGAIVLRLSGRVILLSFALLLATVFLFYWPDPHFTADSWAYFELSRSLREGGYHLQHLRSFAVPPEAPSTAFPPGFPAVWALADILTGTGPRAGIAVNVACMVLIAGQCEVLVRRLSGLPFAGLAVAALLLRFPGFFEEVVAGRSIPLTVALVLQAFLLITRSPAPRAVHAAFAGLCVGGTLLLRFDMLPFVLCLALWMAMAFFRGQRAVAVAFALGLAAICLPWMLASLAIHGRLLASDSSWVAVSADPRAFVTDWYPQGSAPPGAAQDPQAFVQKVSGHILQVPGALILAPGSIGLGLFLMAAALHLAWRPSLYPSGLSFKLKGLTTRPVMAGLAFTLAALAMFPGYVLTGYLDDRYFSLLWLMLLGWLILPLLRLGKPRPAIMAGLAFFTLAGALSGMVLGWGEVRSKAEARLIEAPTANPQQIAACLGKLPPGQTRALVMDPSQAARLAAEHGLRTSMVPRNFYEGRLSEQEKEAFLETFHIGMVVDSPLTEAPGVIPVRWLVPAPDECGPQTYVRVPGVR